MPSYSDDDQGRAARLLTNAITSGELTPAAACEICGHEPAEGENRLDGHHHNGYDEEHALDVQWLCRSCHSRIHTGQKWAQSTNAKLTTEDRSRASRLAHETMRARGTHRSGSGGTKHLQRYWAEHPEQLREAGRRGAAARWAKMTPDQRAEWGRKLSLAGNTAKYGDRSPEERMWLDLRRLANRELKRLRDRGQS